VLAGGSSTPSTPMAGIINGCTAAEITKTPQIALTKSEVKHRYLR